MVVDEHVLDGLRTAQEQDRERSHRELDEVAVPFLQPKELVGMPPHPQQTAPGQDSARSREAGGAAIGLRVPTLVLDRFRVAVHDCPMALFHSSMTPMASYLDQVPLAGLVRIRDMMYSVERPFRLDQGDLSFDAPDTLKRALVQAVADNHTHYVQTTGIPPLVDALVDKLQKKNGIPVARTDDVLVTSGGIHGMYAACQSVLEPGDEVLFTDPEWPPGLGNILAARAMPVAYPLHESLGWRPDAAEMARLITPRTRAIYVNSPNNPTGSVLDRADLQGIAELAIERDLWVFSDEAYEDLVFDGRTHVSIASLPGMYERTISIFTFSKTYAITGLRLGYMVVPDPVIQDRARKILFFTVTNTASVVQHAGVGALRGSQQFVDDLRTELAARRDLFYAALERASDGVLTGAKPSGACYAFARINPSWTSPLPDAPASQSWAMTEFLIRRARVGSVPGADFGARGEGFVRFCFAREREELSGALDAMRALFRGEPTSLTVSSS
jgi:aspartate aminotransferase